MRKAKAFTRDSWGNLWYWDLGWRVNDKPTPDSPPWVFISWRTDTPVGHMFFRKNVELSVDKTSFGARPYGTMWRRMTWDKHMTHNIYGTVQVHATDGVHAIVTDVNNTRLEVQFSNLSEIKSKVTSSGGNSSSSPRPKLPKELKKYRSEAIETLRLEGHDGPIPIPLLEQKCLEVKAAHIERLKKLLK
jgi:hypothetical protein